MPTAYYSVATVAISAAALASSLVLWNHVQPPHAPYTSIDQAIAVDGFSVLIMVLVCVVLILSALFGEHFLRREGIAGPEYYVLAMLSGSGAMFMASAEDLIIVFLGLEILSIALYVLAGLDIRRIGSGEAAMKYFVLGAFSSAIFVYGIALVYGATGTTNIGQIAGWLAHNPAPSDPLLLAGMGLLLVGFGFKVAAVPFHMWTPDVYQGSPTPVVGFMASVAKAGGFAALLRVFFESFGSLKESWEPLVWVLAVLTLLGGAVLALVQRDIKRMLAYSSINHAGFILIGLQALSAKGVASALYYLFTYSVIVVGTFGLISVLDPPGDSVHLIDGYRGLGRRRPVLGLALAVMLMAQAGIPFTTGFLAKFEVLTAAMSAHSYALAVIAMVSAAIAAFFYLRVIAVMYIDPAASGAGAAPAGSALAGSALLPAYAGDEGVVAGDVPGHELAFRGPFLLGGGGVATAVAPAEVSLYSEGAYAEAGDASQAEQSEDEEVKADPELVAGATSDLSPAAGLAIFLSVGFTVVLGIWPQPLFDFAHLAKLLF